MVSTVAKIQPANSRHPILAHVHYLFFFFFWFVNTPPIVPGLLLGGFWDFTSDLGHGDTAYTDLALGAHTDTTYFTDPVGCVRFTFIDKGTRRVRHLCGRVFES